MNSKRIPFPTKAQILRLVEAAKAAGIIVGAVRVNTSGEVTIVDKEALTTKDRGDDLSNYV